ncbi:MAG: T9SS type A sorting domain-containing protein [Flavobacteriales bacterium]|nr:T9SS type A sorting domain-containing protein [Flavobacteriales bacterium]
MSKDKNILKILATFVFVLTFSIILNAQNNVIFGGGNTDGYAMSCYQESYNIPSLTNSIFAGGNSDGYTITCYQESYNIIASTNSIFSGGNSDGFDISCYEENYDIPSLTNGIFSGGNSDGFDIDCYEESYDLPSLTNGIFSGGDADGYTISCYEEEYVLIDNSIFSGGNGDGYSMTCTPTEIPLPVELLSFTGINKNNYNLLEWITASEINNDYFTLYRSEDAFHWQEITEINGSGNSNSTRHYSYKDYFNNSTSSSKTLYYQLKQTDFNGQIEYSNIVVISIDNIDSKITIYPNPTKNILFIRLVNNQENTTLTLYDAQGKLLQQKTLVEGENAIDINKYPKGLYFIKIIEVKGNINYFKVEKI